MSASSDAASEYLTDVGRSPRSLNITGVDRVFGNYVSQWIAVCGSILFCVTWATHSLYSINQNTKFLHGLAKALPDRLGADWTAATVDGLPAFSALVLVVARYGHPFIFYVVEAVLLACLFYSSFFLMVRIARNNGRSLHYQLGCAATLIFLACLDLPFLFVRGVADQYLVGGYLQPSELGVLFVAAFALVCAGRKNSAIIAAAVPATFHPGYIALSIIVAGSIVVAERVSWRYLLIAIVLIAAPLIDLALRFAPTNVDTFREAASILAFQRIPLHADPALWLGPEAYVKLGVGLLGLCLAPRGFLRIALGALLVWAIAGYVAVASMRSADLALVAPWRASIIIVPISTVVILARLGDASFKLSLFARIRPVISVLFVLLAVVVAGKSAASKMMEYGAKQTPAYIEFVLANHQSEDVYLTSPSEYAFRLEAMTAQFVSWKTHPYLDREVLEWYRRVTLAQKVFGEGGVTQSLDCTALSTLARLYPVTHVFLRDSNDARGATCSILQQVFSGDGGRIFRINRASL